MAAAPRPRTSPIVTFLAGRALPWFALGFVLVAVGVLAFDGTTEAQVVFAGMVVLVAACIHDIVLAVRDDPLRSSIVAA
jgi:hypothetical protein